MMSKTRIGDGLDAGLEQLGIMLGQIKDGEVKPAELKKMLTEVYESSVGTIRPYLKEILSLIPEKLPNDLKPFLLSLITCYKKIIEDSDIQKVVIEINNITAKRRSDILKEYKKAGFSRPEAMQLLLADISNHPVMTVMKSVGSGSISSSKKGSGSSVDASN
jgi:hypothetical protein